MEEREREKEWEIKKEIESKWRGKGERGRIGEQLIDTGERCENMCTQYAKMLIQCKMTGKWEIWYKINGDKKKQKIKKITEKVQNVNDKL